MRFILTGLAAVTPLVSPLLSPLVAQADWAHASDGDPAPRESAAMAYDATRDAVWLFGGNTSHPNRRLDTLWRWDGARWTAPRVTGLRPPRLFAASMAFDASRSRVVLLGRGATLQTWEWDGSAWRWNVTSTMPPLFEFTQMAYDTVRRRIVLVGTERNGFAYSTSTWEYNGVDWQQRQPTTPLPPRSDFAMAFDQTLGRTIVYGGELGIRGGTLGADTWAYDGSTWTRLQTPLSAGARAGARMIHGGGVTLLVGGYHASSGPYAFDGQTWTEVGLRQEETPPLVNTAVAWHASRQELCVFGGYARDNGTEHGATWIWDGASWRGSAPPSSGGGGWAFDAVRDRAVMIGGGGASVPGLADLWLWDGVAWRHRRPVPAPAARQGAALVFDSRRGHVVAFGGEGAVLHADTWSWDGSQWRDLRPASRPLARSSHRMVYDRARDQIVLFGGSSRAAVLGDTWTFDGSEWIRQRPTVSPVARSQHGLAYDALRGVTVLFGGQDSGVGFGDTWEWDGAAWRDVTPSSGSPAARYAFGMVYDAARQRTVLQGGRSDRDPNRFYGIDDTWEWDGTAWAPGPAGVGRTGHAMAYDSRRERVLSFGGAGLSLQGDRLETFEFATGYPAQARTFGRGCAARPALEFATRPWIGDTARATATSTRSPGILLAGTSTTSWGSFSLPLDLSSAGAPGCALLTSITATLPSSAPRSGSVSWQLALPNDRALAGSLLYAQAVVADPAANALGLALTDGVELRIGIR